MRVVLELDDEDIRTGYIRTTVHEEKGTRTGLITLEDLSEMVGRFHRWELGRRRVRMISRFSDSALLAYGENGRKWEACATIAPADYYLISATGKVYHVHLPRLVVWVSNQRISPRIFWTGDDVPTPESRLFPLIIGNTYNSGSVCIGNSGLKCKTPKDIDTYIRQLIETQASHTVTNNTDKLYRALTRKWAPGIGRKYAITLAKLMASSNNGAADDW